MDKHAAKGIKDKLSHTFNLLPNDKFKNLNWKFHFENKGKGFAKVDKCTYDPNKKPDTKPDTDGKNQNTNKDNLVYCNAEVLNKIYAIDPDSGDLKKTITIDDLENRMGISDIVEYNGYLYFTGNYSGGTGLSIEYICRIKTDGTGFEKLISGSKPHVYNGKIFYLSQYYSNNEDIDLWSSVPDGIAYMNPDGSDMHYLVTKGEGDSFTDYNNYYNCDFI